MAPFVPPEPPEPIDPVDPPALNVPLPPPEVGFGSPWVPANAENRDRILDWWRAWWRRVFFPWIGTWTTYWNTWRHNLIEYLTEWLNYAGEYIEEHAVAGYSWRKTVTALNAVGDTDVVITPYDELRPLLVGDLVSDTSAMTRYGQIVAVIDTTHATVQTLGSLRGIEGHSWWTTVTDIAPSGTTPVVLPVDSDPNRYPQVGDLVSDQSDDIRYGSITSVIDATHVIVTPLGILRGPQGEQGIQGEQGDPGVIQELVAGTNITIDSTDPAAPVISATGGGGGGGVESVVAGDNVTVDDTDPANPIVSAHGTGFGVVESIIAGTNITVDDTDPANPIVSATGGGGGGIVESVVAGARITVDDTDPANPIVSTANGIPLNVFPTVDRPPALVNGDAYFDSTLLIPVWSYGGVWRDSEGNVIPDATPEIEIVNPVIDDAGGLIDASLGALTYSGTTGLTGLTYLDRPALSNDGWFFFASGGVVRTTDFSAFTFYPVEDMSISGTADTVIVTWVESGDFHAIVGEAAGGSNEHVYFNGSTWVAGTALHVDAAADWMISAVVTSSGRLYYITPTGGTPDTVLFYCSSLSASPTPISSPTADAYAVTSDGDDVYLIWGADPNDAVNSIAKIDGVSTTLHFMDDVYGGFFPYGYGTNGHPNGGIVTDGSGYDYLHNDTAYSVDDEYQGVYQNLFRNPSSMLLTNLDTLNGAAPFAGKISFDVGFSDVTAFVAVGVYSGGSMRLICLGDDLGWKVATIPFTFS